MRTAIAVIICVILPALAAPWTAGAQPNNSQQQEAVVAERGLKGGLVSARFTNGPLETAPAGGFTIGAYMSFELSRRFTFLTELYYAEKGSKVRHPSFQSEFDLNLTYVEVPLLVNFLPPVGSALQPRLFAGPYAGFIIDSSSSFTVEDGTVVTPDDFVEQTSDVDWGAVVGAGVDADLSFRTFTLEFRYSAGLSSVFNDAVEGDYRNGVFSILFGFSL